MNNYDIGYRSNRRHATHYPTWRVTSLQSYRCASPKHVGLEACSPHQTLAHGLCGPDRFLRTNPCNNHTRGASIITLTVISCSEHTWIYHIYVYMVNIYIYGVYIYMSVCVMVCIYIYVICCVYMYIWCIYIYMCVCVVHLYLYIYIWCIYVCVCGVYIYILNYEYISVTNQRLHLMTGMQCAPFFPLNLWSPSRCTPSRLWPGWQAKMSWCNMMQCGYGSKYRIG